MIITGNSMQLGAGITNNPANSTNPSGTPASATPAKFYRPAGNTSRWTGGVDSSSGNLEWKITKGSVVPPSWYYMTPTNDGSQWEIQHPMSGPEGFFRYGLQVRFDCYFDDVDVATMEGKDLLEVRMVIPDGALAYMTVPAATPDKPYLAVGFIVRCVGGKYKIYNLDADITAADAMTTALLLYKRSTAGFRLRYDGYNFYGGVNNYQKYFKPIRTDVNTPAGTLCIRSGANPVKEAGFNYLESVIPLERINHTLTPEDNNATFYCPWGYGTGIQLTLPDTPLPEGFRVSAISEAESSITSRPENRNVTWNGSDGKPSSGSMNSGGRQTLIQTGKNGKTWLII